MTSNHIECLVVLDFDGVLNNTGSMLALGGVRFDPVSVGLVSRLITETSAKVLISSSWRIGFKDVEAFRKDILAGDGRRLLGDADMSTIINAIVGLTPSIMFVHEQHEARGLEIDTWMSSRSIGRYVILDDDSDMMTKQLPFFVKTQFADGFRAMHYHRALSILMPEHKDVSGLAPHFDQQYYKQYTQYLTGSPAKDEEHY